jgi:hypothetical protein
MFFSHFPLPLKIKNNFRKRMHCVYEGRSISETLESIGYEQQDHGYHVRRLGDIAELFRGGNTVHSAEYVKTTDLPAIEAIIRRDAFLAPILKHAFYPSMAGMMLGGISLGYMDHHLTRLAFVGVATMIATLIAMAGVSYTGDDCYRRAKKFRQAGASVATGSRALEQILRAAE